MQSAVATGQDFVIAGLAIPDLAIPGLAVPGALAEVDSTEGAEVWQARHFES